MKRHLYIIITALLAVVIAVFSGCAGCNEEPTPIDPTPPPVTPVDPTPPPVTPTDTVSVTALKAEIALTTDELESFNFATLFDIKSDGETIAVIPSYIDKSDLKAEAGEYTVTCTYKGKSASVKVKVSVPAVVEVSALVRAVTIESFEVSDYDYSSLFDIKSDGAAVAVLSEYIDKSAVKAEKGRYTVICSYGSESASVTVTVVKNEYTLTATESEITLSEYAYPKYNFKSYFHAALNGVEVEITDDMVTSDLKAEAGVYTYTVKHGDKTVSLKVTVTKGHEIQIVKSYALKEIPENELEDFDFTTLFSAYVDATAVEVKEDMIDKSALANAEVGHTYDVTVTVESDESSETAEAQVKIVPALSVAVSTKNIETYPNAGVIDFTELFEITYGGEKIPVTYDMVSGAVDYSKAGDNEITLEYEGRTYTAKVTVVMGVVIEYAKGDTVTVRKGTDISTYSFGGDFIVTINGIRYNDIERCIDTSEVDFSETGEYTATITVNYNTDALDFFGINFTTVTKDITYRVVDVEYSLRLREETVHLDKGTASYNVFNNIRLSVNGINQTLTNDKRLAVNINSTYAEILSDELNFAGGGEQEVEIAVYVYGPDEEPITVTFTVDIESDIVLEGSELALFGSTTLYTKDLFTLTENGVRKAVTQDMVSGYVNTFKAGTYTVTAEYKGMTATSHVIVYDSGIVGRYKTSLQPISSLTPVDDDEDDDNGYWEYDTDIDYEPYALAAASTRAASSRLSDLVVYADGRITLHGAQMSDIRCIDINTLSFMYGSNMYTMYYSDGIAVLIPDNSLALGYTDYRRPMTYFNTNKWLVPNGVSINYSDLHVLTLTYPSYSIDISELSSPDGSETMWYGLKTRLTEKSSSDTFYEVTWGEVTFAPNFACKAGTVSSLEICGETYEFTMSSESVGKVNKTTATNPFVGKTFTGTVGGEQAMLKATANGYDYSVGDRVIFRSYGSTYEISNYMIGGGVDLSTNTIVINCYAAHDNIDIMSYRFKVDPENNTFELVKRDTIFGRYENDTMAIFIDGYGNGCVQFDKKSSIKTKFTYTYNSGELTIRYQDTNSRFEYGKESKFYVAPLLNVLTVKEFTGLDIVGTTLENTFITDGAIVRIKSFTIGADSQGETQLWNAFEITDKNGTWTNTDKADETKLDTSKVEFTKPGFYQLILRVPVDGKTVESYYSIQVLETVYTNNAVIASGGAGVIYPSASLLMDGYGRAFVTYGGITFTGSVTVNEDNTFVIKAYNTRNEYLYGTGSLTADGLISVRFGGAMQFADYFTSGTRRVIGTEGLVLREFTASETKTYIAANSTSGLGEKVTVEVVEGESVSAAGALLKITYGDGTVRHVRIASWGNTVDGLTVVNM